MSQQICERIFVRVGQQSLCWPACDNWDRTTMLACLSSDPRSIDELALAWSRYRPDQPLMELEWRKAASEADPVVAADDQPLSAEQGGAWLAIDLVNQRYAWCDSQDLTGQPGCYELEADGSEPEADGPEPDDDGPGPHNRLAWINLPPWWQRVPAEQWSFDARQPGADDADDAPAGSAESEARPGPLDFRTVLYGRPLVKYIAEQALAARSKPWLANPGRDAVESAPAISQYDERSCEERAQVKRWEVLTKRIHARWLTTARAELMYQTPRSFLHIYRDWKDRELEYRRSQWSRDRRPPPPAPRTSDLFRYGPMGTEEVCIYFDICRQLISMALQWCDDEPRLKCADLIDRLERVRDGWLRSEEIEGDRVTVQEVIDSERQLMPRVASSDPIDCDCPLCRMQALEPEMFGPAFFMCDTFREEMEEEFVFSLHARREDWQNARDEWLSWSDSMSVRHISPGKSQDGEVEHDAVSPTDQSTQAESAQGDWATVWQSSYSDMSYSSPQLSLFSIGAHLAEIIDELKRLSAAREEIDELNRAFDELTRSIRHWLTREATGDPIGGRSASLEPAAGQMVQLLEGLARKHRELTAKSADLQSQIHQWQRQLSPAPGG